MQLSRTRKCMTFYKINEKDTIVQEWKAYEILNDNLMHYTVQHCIIHQKNPLENDKQ